MRIAIGVLCFAIVVVFAGPAPLAFCISLSDRSGDPVGLALFGVTWLLLFGIPGFFAFPYERRVQAVGWLAFAAMVYLLLLLSFIAVMKHLTWFPLSAGNRVFLAKVNLRYGAIALTVAVQTVAWLLLFRKRRTVAV